MQIIFKRLLLVIVPIFYQIIGNHSLIIPDEVPSLLSVIYSNIPTIKKGTDSRLGWGFRFGNRADFQVLVELGPQLNTQPLGNQPDTTNNKRNTIDTLSNELYAKRQRQKHEEHQKLLKAAEQQNSQSVDESEGGGWLKLWHKSMMKQKQPVADLPLEPRPGLALGEIDAKSVIPDDSVLELEEMYRKTQKGLKAKEGNHTKIDNVSLE